MYKLPKSADNIYVNVGFINSPITAGASDASIEMSAAISKNTTIIPDGSDYYLTVVNFSCPLSEVPLFIAPVIAGSGTSQKMPLVFGITIGGSNYPINLIYVPDNNVTLPIQADSTQQLFNDGYWVYSYEKLADLMNTALTSAYSAAGSPGDPAGAPFFRFDAATERFQLIVSKAFLTAGASIFMNTWSNKYIQSNRTYFWGYDQPDGRDMDFITPLNAAFNIDFPTGFPAISDYLAYDQEWQSLQNISSVRQIIVTSGSLKCTPEYIPVGTISQNNSSTLPIISSFLPSFDSPGANESRAIYTPFLYRFLDIQSPATISELYINFYWQDEFSNVHPIYLGPGETGSLKLGFIKKDLVKGNAVLKKL